jgi:hypothetical protein
MMSFLPSKAQPLSNENRLAQGAGAGLAGERNAIEHQRLIAVGERD